MLSIVSGWGWVGSRTQWLLSLIVVVPFASTADLSSVSGLIEMTLAGTVKERSLLAFPEVNFWVRTL